MNVGIVTMWFERGAGYVSRQYQQILKAKFNIFIYVRAGEYLKGNMTWDANNVTWGKQTNLPVATAIDRKDFEKWVTTNQIDIVFFNEQHWWEPLQWCLQLGVKTGAYIDYYTEETIPFFACYDFLLCNTQRHFSAFSWHPQAYYIPWGTDIHLFKPQRFEAVQPDRLTFFHSCGYSPKRKGTDFVLEAFDRMSAKAHLVIHTQVDLCKALPEHQNRIVKLQEAGSLEIIHKTVSAPGLYHLGDVYLGPSRLEGIGLPLIEAQACGLPLITCDNPPMNEFVPPESGSAVKIRHLWSRKDGYYWPQCAIDVSALAATLDHYATNFRQICYLKQTTRQYVEKSLNWMDRAERVQQIFSDTQTNITNKTSVAAQIAQFEQSRHGLHYRLSVKHPRLIRLYQNLRKIV